MSLWADKSKRQFYDSWEFMPEDRRQELKRRFLKDYIHFSRELKYYGDRTQGYDGNSSHPLKAVPVLNSSDIRDLLPPISNALVTGGLRDYTVFQSGGTTGSPKSTLFSHGELEGLNLPNARGFYACGLVPEDRVGNLFAVGSLYMTFVHINRMLQQYGCQNFPFSNHTAVDFVHTVVKQFDVRVLTGIASVVLNALRGMKKIGLEGIQIEKIFYGGEHFYEADKKEIEATFGTKVILAPGYGTVDTWYLGYQCTQTPTGVFHAHDDQVYLEVVDENTGDLTKPGEIGMLYCTAFPRRLTPIVRYRVGDRVKWTGESCACGRTTPLFQLLGRGDDVLRIGYDSIDYNAIQDLVLSVSGLSGTVQMEKQREAGKDRFIVRVESELSAADRPAAAAELVRAVLDSRPSIRDFLSKGSVWPVQVEVVDPGTLPRNVRTGKLMRVIDCMG